jgi:Carboxypeptidase regulatory-like domain
MICRILSQFRHVSWRIAFWPAVVAVIATSAQGQAFSGKVIDSNGNPVGGALVTALRTSTVPWTSSRTSSQSDGSFIFSSLTAGAYEFCAQVLAGGYLNPCEWSLNPPTVTVTAGNAATGFVLKMAIGSLLQIQVQDPSNVASAAASSAR